MAELEVTGEKPVMGEDRAALRNAVLADWGKDAPAAPAAAAPEDAPAETPEPAAPDAPAEEGEPAVETPDEKPTDPEIEPAAAAPEAADPELSKRLEAVQAQEKRKLEAIDRARSELANERAAMQREMDAQRREIAAQLDELKRFEEVKRRAKFDPAGVFEALGYDAEDWEPAARQFYGRSPAAQQDPRLRAEAERALRDRETYSRTSALEQKVEALTKQLHEREQRAQQEKLVADYLAKTEKAVSDETPIVRNMLSKNAERTRNRLGELAESIYNETGEVPDPVTLVRELEKHRRAELEESGVDVAQIFKTTKQATPVAGEKRNGRTTLSSELTTPTKPRTEPQTREELRAETLRALEAGELD